MKKLALLAMLVGCGGATSSPAAIESGDHSFDVDGHAVAYHVAGTGPVCVVHPGGPGVEWTYLRMPEVERFLTLVYLEPVGTGASGRLPRPNDYSYARYAADVDALREQLGLEKVCLLGHSHGGLVALTYAVEHPERLSALIVYGSTAALDGEWNRAMNAEIEAHFAQQPFAADARAAVGAFYGAEDDEAATAAFRRWTPMMFDDWESERAAIEPQLAGLHVWAGPARYRGPVFDVSARLGVIHAPTLVITGDHDYAMPPPTAERVHRGIAGSELVVMERSGHMAHLEHPAEFAAAIERFARAAHL